MSERAERYILEVTLPKPIGDPIPADADFTKVGYTTSKGFNESTGRIDANSDENPNWEDGVPGMSTFSFSGETLYTFDDPGQQAIKNAKRNQDEDNAPWFRVTNNREGAEAFAGQVIVEELEYDWSNGELVAFTLSTSGRGAPVFATIPPVV